MFGRQKSSDGLSSKIVSVEDVLMASLPRVAATEQRLNAVDSRVCSPQAQMDMHAQGTRRFDENQEEQASGPATGPALPTHRWPGALPKPSAPHIKGFPEGQLQAPSTPPGSAAIRAEPSPTIIEDKPENTLDIDKIPTKTTTITTTTQTTQSTNVAQA